jgi:hypothetical protein
MEKSVFRPRLNSAGVSGVEWREMSRIVVIRISIRIRERVRCD